MFFFHVIFPPDKDRVISELNRSDKKYLRAKGKMLSWNRNLYRILFTFTEHRLFDQFILFVVLLNTGLLVAQTYQSIAIRTGNKRRQKTVTVYAVS